MIAAKGDVFDGAREVMKNYGIECFRVAYICVTFANLMLVKKFQELKPVTERSHFGQHHVMIPAKLLRVVVLSKSANGNKFVVRDDILSHFLANFGMTIA